MREPPEKFPSTLVPEPSLEPSEPRGGCLLLPSVASRAEPLFTSLHALRSQPLLGAQRHPATFWSESYVKHMGVGPLGKGSTYPF